MAGNAEDAEDWAQECFVRAYRELKRYNPAMPFRPWMFRVTSNACINLAKTRSRRRDRIDLGIDHLSIPAGHESDPMQSALAMEDTRAIRSAMETLPLKMRQAVVLRLLEGLSFRELGEILGVPTQTAATRVRRALIRVRDQLNRDGVEVVV
jgi:RNA polymerase sigma-70 factor (ECF subfamily)